MSLQEGVPKGTGGYKPFWSWVQLERIMTIAHLIVAAAVVISVWAVTAAWAESVWVVVAITTSAAVLLVPGLYALIRVPVEERKSGTYWNSLIIVSLISVFLAFVYVTIQPYEDSGGELVVRTFVGLLLFGIFIWFLIPGNSPIGMLVAWMILGLALVWMWVETVVRLTEQLHPVAGILIGLVTTLFLAVMALHVFGWHLLAYKAEEPIKQMK